MSGFLPHCGIHRSCSCTSECCECRRGGEELLWIQLSFLLLFNKKMCCSKSSLTHDKSWDTWLASFLSPILLLIQTLSPYWPFVHQSPLSNFFVSDANKQYVWLKAKKLNSFAHINYITVFIWHFWLNSFMNRVLLSSTANNDEHKLSNTEYWGSGFRRDSLFFIFCVRIKLGL